MNVGCIGTRRSSISALFAREVPQTVTIPKTPMAPRGAPSAEQIERRISDPLFGAGGGFPLRQ